MTDDRVILLTGETGSELNALGARLTASGYVVHRLSTRGRTHTGPSGRVRGDGDHIADYLVQTVNRHGRLDAVVQYAADSSNHDLSDWMRTVQDLMKMVIPIFREQGRGLILDVVPLQRPSSDAMRIALAGAMKAYSEALAHRLQDYGIRVLFMSPTTSRTTTSTAALITTLLGEEGSDAVPLNPFAKVDAARGPHSDSWVHHSKNIRFKGEWRVDEQEAVHHALSSHESDLQSDTRLPPRKWTFVKVAGPLETSSEHRTPARRVCYTICRSDVHYPTVAPTLQGALQKTLGLSDAVVPNSIRTQIDGKISI